MTATPAVVGVDPGAKHTGIVVRRGSDLLYAATVERDLTGLARYIAEVLEAVDVARNLRSDAVVAVEAVTPPTGFADGQRRPIGLGPLIDVAAVYGAVLGYAPDAIVVPPEHNGQGPVALYPAPLRPARGKGAGYDKLRHVRSAWDVAATGALILRASTPA